MTADKQTIIGIVALVVALFLVALLVWMPKNGSADQLTTVVQPVGEIVELDDADYIVILFSSTGEEVQSWEVAGGLQVTPAGLRFQDRNEQTWLINGTYICVEVPKGSWDAVREVAGEEEETPPEESEEEPCNTPNPSSEEDNQ